MPRVGGLEILAMLREDAVLRHIPVIVLTSSTDPQVKLKALAMGAMDFLSKPVDPSELGLRIRNTRARTAST
jgi:CheY-like chemotaxis protein